MVDSIEFLDRNFIFDNNTSSLIETDYPTFYKFPVIYVIYSNKSMTAYVGETTNISSRIRQHLRDAEKSKLKNIKVIFSHYFNKSAVLDIEANLIKYMGADGSYMLLNANDGITDHEFYQRQDYNNTFYEIWDRFKLDNLVKHDILDIENSDLIIHCGACMFNRTQTLSRVEKAKALNSPMTNYGITIAYLKGILDDVVIPD